MQAGGQVNSAVPSHMQQTVQGWSPSSKPQAIEQASQKVRLSFLSLALLPVHYWLFEHMAGGQVTMVKQMLANCDPYQRDATVAQAQAIMTQLYSEGDFWPRYALFLQDSAREVATH